MRVSTGFSCRELGLEVRKLLSSRSLCSLILCGGCRREGDVLDRLNIDPRELVQQPDELIDKIDSAVNHVLQNRQNGDLHVSHKVRNRNTGLLPAELEFCDQVHDPVHTDEERELNCIPADDQCKRAEVPGITETSDRLNPLIDHAYEYANHYRNPENRVRK